MEYHIPWSHWLDELAVVRDVVSNMIRFSGAKVFYFGTSPGNHAAAVNTSKTGMKILL